MTAGLLVRERNAEVTAPGPSTHRPVLAAEVAEVLGAPLRGLIVDATVGGGGHAARLLALSPEARLLGVDRDPAALAAAGERLKPFGGRVRLVQANFRDLPAVLAEAGEASASAILFDFGASDFQLRSPERGFSFLHEGPLDMRMGPDAAESAADLLRRVASAELADLLRRFGEERRAGSLARRILAARDRGALRTTLDLARTVTGGREGRGGGRIHPATRVFQAIRIAVNDELGAVERSLPGALDVLGPGGRVAAIAFHSLEDRIVKRFFGREARDCVCPPEQPVCTCRHRSRLRILTPKPVRPGAGELADNPSSRSARLRAAEKR